MAQRHVVPQNIEDMVQVGHISDACFDINSDDAEVVYFNTIEGVEIEDPILTKIIWPGPRGTLVEHWMKKGQVIPFHRHHSEFLNLLVKGQVKVTLAGKQYTAGQYDSWTAVPGVDHSIEALEDSMIMEFFYPAAVMQKDFFLTWGTARPATTHLFVREADVKPTPLPLVEGTDEKSGDSAIAPKMLIPGPNVLLLLAKCKPQKRAWHVHHHNWITYMVSGGFRVWQGGTEFDAPGGHYWGAAPGVDQANMAPDDCVIVEIKWPPPQICHGKLKSWEAPVEAR
jgi:quercetin dioxygenase-like cupin family protein